MKLWNGVELSKETQSKKPWRAKVKRRKRGRKAETEEGQAKRW